MDFVSIESFPCEIFVQNSKTFPKVFFQNSKMAQKRKTKTSKATLSKENPILLIDESIRKFKSSEELLHLADRLFQKEPQVIIYSVCLVWSKTFFSKLNCKNQTFDFRL